MKNLAILGGAIALLALLAFAILAFMGKRNFEDKAEVARTKERVARAEAATPRKRATSRVSPPNEVVQALSPPEGSPEDDQSVVTIQGVVLDAASNAPVAGAEVRAAFDIGDTPSELVYTAKADADGAYTLKGAIISGGHTLVCTAKGYAEARKPQAFLMQVMPGQSVRADFMLSPGARILGRVVRTDTGAPVAGAQIHVQEDRRWTEMVTGMPLERKATSGEDGTYSVENLDGGSYRVSAATDDMSLSTSRDMLVSLERGADKEVVLNLDATGAVEGTVRSADGKPLKELSVYCSHHGTGNDEEMYVPESRGPVSTITGQSFRIVGLKAGQRYRVVASAKNVASANSEEFTVTLGEQPRHFDLVLTNGSTVIGVAVYEDGQPAAGLQLMLSPEFSSTNAPMSFHDDSSRTGEDGSFKISGLGEGVYRLFAEKDFMVANGMMREESEYSVELKVDGITNVNDIRLTVKGTLPGTGGIITGHVLGIDGTPLKDASVMAFSLDDHSSPTSTTTDEAGSFRLENLHGNSFHVSANADDATASQNDVPPSADISLQLEVQPKVSGLVVDASGEGVAHAEVWLEEVADTANDDPMADFKQLMQHRDRATTGDFGAFELRGLSIGTFQVKASSRERGNGESESFALDGHTGRSGIRISLVPGVTLGGRVLNSQGKPVAGATVTLTEALDPESPAYEVMKSMPMDMFGNAEQFHTGDDGKYTFRNVAAGDVELRVKVREFAPPQPRRVTVVAGQDQMNIDFKLKPGAASRGRLWQEIRR